MSTKPDDTPRDENLTEDELDEVSGGATLDGTRTVREETTLDRPDGTLDPRGRLTQLNTHQTG